MNYPFIIPPFGNWNVADSAITNVKQNTSSEPPKFQGKELVNILPYGDKEKKMVFMLPIEHGKDIYIAAFPDPILLYLSISHNQFQFSEQIKSQLFEKEALKSNKNIRMLWAEINNTNGIYNAYLQSRICSIIMLHSSIEAFVNLVIPENVQYPWVTKKGTKILNKQEIDKKIIFKDRLIKVLKFVTEIDLENNYKDLTDSILSFYQVRNDFIHLKSYMENNFKPSHTTVFSKMLNMDIEAYLIVAHKFMNLIKPNYILKRENESPENLD